MTDKGIITDLWDSDFYKYTMLYFIMENFADMYVEFELVVRDFKDGTRAEFTETDLANIKREICAVGSVGFLPSTTAYVGATAKFLPEWYLMFLDNYRLRPDDVEVWLEGTELHARVKGMWLYVSPWEILVLEIACECYYRERATITSSNLDEAYTKAYSKAKRLREMGAYITDMTARRRSCREIEIACVQGLKAGAGDHLLGTSNANLAATLGLSPRGTRGHEIDMVLGGVFGMKWGTQMSLELWNKTFRGSLGIVLPDTFTLQHFLRFFGPEEARSWDGARHDSGDAIVFGDTMKAHYGKLQIPTQGKRLMFSNFSGSDSTEAEVKTIYDRFGRDFLVSVGMGQYFMWFPKGMNPLNIVMKPTKARRTRQTVEWPLVDLVKISDSPGKHHGKPEVVERYLRELREWGIEAT